MYLRCFSILIGLLCFQTKAQTSKDSIFEDHSISTELFTKCFENLNQGSQIFEKHPSLKSMKFCSLLECMYLLSYNDNDIKLAAEYRLQGITTQLYKEGHPVYLINGLDSFLTAEEKNKDLNDDNHLVFINYAECIAPKFLSEGAEIINKQTTLLLKGNKVASE